MKTILTILFTILFCYVTIAQTTDQDDSTKSKIRVFEPNTSAKSSSDNYYKWAVKTDLFAILTGEFPLIGEYRIAKKFSVEASAGVTYSYFDANIFDDDSDGFTYDGSLLSSENAELGSAFRAAIKYFPSSDYDAIEGWYFGIQLMSKTNNRSYLESDGYSGDKMDKRVKTGASIVIGKQIFQDSNIIWDFFFGAGISNVEHTFHSYNSETNVISEIQTSKSQPNILLGLRIGFGN